MTLILLALAVLGGLPIRLRQSFHVRQPVKGDAGKYTASGYLILFSILSAFTDRTCRLRRKKCDEQRIDDSCQTCVRLTIECLGWGSKRPEWMRDKEAVDRYKAEIKARLSRAGMIRGQPRTSSSPSTQLPAGVTSYPMTTTAQRGRRPSSNSRQETTSRRFSFHTSPYEHSSAGPTLSSLSFTYRTLCISY
jgi:hypothetical protein